jgi:hypothetical protein
MLGRFSGSGDHGWPVLGVHRGKASNPGICKCKLLQSIFQSGLFVPHQATCSAVLPDPCLDTSTSVLDDAVEGRRQAKCNSPKSGYRPGALTSPVWSRLARTAISRYRDAFHLAHNLLPGPAKSLRNGPPSTRSKLDLLFKLATGRSVWCQPLASYSPFKARAASAESSVFRRVQPPGAADGRQSDAAVCGKSQPPRQGNVRSSLTNRFPLPVDEEVRPCRMPPAAR